MADYIVSNDFKTMEEIWDDILRLHWEYLDTEENMEKLKMRRKLEGKIKRFLFWHHQYIDFSISDELKEFLSIVQHDRKFFLIETAHVFKQSVLKLDQFSAYKALMGFEAISQYANNLFRKPWRREYRCIKVSSDFDLTNHSTYEIVFVMKNLYNTSFIRSTAIQRILST